MATSAYTYTTGIGLQYGQGKRSLLRLSDGTVLLAYYEGGATDDIVFRYSTNPASTWNDVVAGDITDAYTGDSDRFAWCVDADDQIHVIYEDSSSYASYKRGTFSTNTITWDAEQDFTARDVRLRTGGVVAFKVGTDDHVWHAHSDGSYGYIWHIKVTSGGTVTEETWEQALTSALFTQIDFSHTGDGITPKASPHVWISGARSVDDLVLKKYAYSSGPTWTPGSEQTYANNGPDSAYWAFSSFFNGTEHLTVATKANPGYVVIIGRDEADTTWDEKTASPDSGLSDHTSAAYDGNTGDVWAFRRDSATDLQYCKYDYGADSWDVSWTEIEAGTVPSNSVAPRFASNYSNIEVVWQDSVLGTVRWHEVTTLNQAPDQPTWNNIDNDVEDVAETLLLDWNFVDDDPADTQSKYKLERRKNNNLLPAPTDANFETTIGWWVAYEGCVVTRSSAQAKEGTWSMLVDVTGGVAWRVGPVPSGNYGATVTAAEALQYGIPYNPAFIYFQWAIYGVGHTNNVNFYWDQYDADGAYLAGDAATYAASSGSWSGLNSSAAIDANTAYVIPVFYGDSSYAAGEDVHIDELGLSVGSSVYEVPNPDWYTGAAWSTEQWVTTGTESVTLAASWGLDADDPHIYSVWTNDGTADSVSKSAPLRVIPSGQDNPTINAIGTITAKSFLVQWTVTTQTKHHLRIYRDVGLTDLEYDNGIVVTGTKSDTIPFNGEGSRWIWLTTWNDEGLASDVDTEEVYVDWADPPRPVVKPNSTVIELSTSGNSTLSVRGTGGSDEEQGQSFQATTNSTVTAIGVRTDTTGSPTDTVTCTIYSDSNFTTAIGTSDPRNAPDLGGVTWLYSVFNFPTPVSVVSGTTYYVAFSRSDTYDAVNYVSIRQRVVANPYANGQRYTKNSGTWSGASLDDIWMMVFQSSSAVAGAMSVVVANPTPGAGEGGTAATNYNEIWRREWDDDTTAIRIDDDLAEDGTFVDYGVASGVAYQYKAVAWNTANTTSHESDWTA